ncbi:MAG: hypothetical protein M9950_04485 [Thermomicrobiales bacterium]|nr:hypothetical protein [Thermomicrobiales bacterium]
MVTDASGAFAIEFITPRLDDSIVLEDRKWQGSSRFVSSSFDHIITATPLEEPVDSQVVRVVDRNSDPVNDFHLQVFTSAGNSTTYLSNGLTNEITIPVVPLSSIDDPYLWIVTVTSESCGEPYTARSKNAVEGVDLSLFVLDCEVGVVTPTETPVTPSPEATETPVAEANPVSIIVRTADGTSLTGAPFGIYAPAASTLPAGAIFTGTVGANNTITIPDALPGAYVIKVAPAAGDLVEFGVQRSIPPPPSSSQGLDGEETLKFVKPDQHGDTFFSVAWVYYEPNCGWDMWVGADQSGGKGTLTFTNASGWKQVIEKDIPANHGTISQAWCSSTGSPDTAIFDVVMNSGGRFFYKVMMHGDGNSTFIGGQLVSTTPAPTETPTAPTETPTSQNITVQVITADGSSLAGAPFGVYAPAAATLPAGAIHTGTVEANNILTLPDLLPGDYVIRIAPVDGDLIEFTIEIGEDTDKLVVNLRQTDPGATETPAATETPVSSETPAATEKPTEDATVDSLPQTGAGGSPSSLLLIVTAATVMVGGFAFVVRTGEVRRRA